MVQVTTVGHNCVTIVLSGEISKHPADSSPPGKDMVSHFAGVNIISRLNIFARGY